MRIFKRLMPLFGYEARACLSESFHWLSLNLCSNLICQPGYLNANMSGCVQKTGPVPCAKHFGAKVAGSSIKFKMISVATVRER